MSRLWTTADGRQISVQEMDDSHLIRSIKYLKRRSVEIGLSELDPKDLRPMKLQERHREENLRQVATSLRILVTEAKRRNLDGWVRLGIEFVKTLED